MTTSMMMMTMMIVMVRLWMAIVKGGADERCYRDIWTVLGMLSNILQLRHRANPLLISGLMLVF